MHYKYTHSYKLCTYRQFLSASALVGTQRPLSYPTTFLRTQYSAVFRRTGLQQRMLLQMLTSCWCDSLFELSPTSTMGAKAISKSEPACQCQVARKFVHAFRYASRTHPPSSCHHRCVKILREMAKTGSSSPHRLSPLFFPALKWTASRFLKVQRCQMVAGLPEVHAPCLTIAAGPTEGFASP